MASLRKEIRFPEQIKESRRKIRDCFKRSHEALQLRESILLSLIDEIEEDYDCKIQKMENLIKTLNTNKSMISDTLTDDELKVTLEGFISLINKQMTELTAETDYIMYFDWNIEFETGIEKLGNIITLNDEANQFKGLELKQKIYNEIHPISKPTVIRVIRRPSKIHTALSQQEPQSNSSKYTNRLHRLSLPVNLDNN